MWAGLSDLDLTRCVNITDKALVSVATHCLHLTSLLLYASAAPADEGLAAGLSPSLVSFSFSLSCLILFLPLLSHSLSPSLVSFSFSLLAVSHLRALSLYVKHLHTSACS